MHARTDIHKIAGQEDLFTYAGYPPAPVLDTLTTQRNKDGTITVLCLDYHQWNTGMQEVPTPDRFRERVEKAIEEEAGLEIHKLMVLSTSHISAEVNERLGDGDFTQKELDAFLDEDVWYVPVWNMDGGYLIGLDHEPKDSFGNDPECIKNIVLYARKHGCLFVRLDRDGPQMKDLPTYEW